MFICSFHYPITKAIELVLLHSVVVEHATFFASLRQARFLGQINLVHCNYWDLKHRSKLLKELLWNWRTLCFLCLEAKISIDLYEMFQDADLVLLIGAKPRLADLLDINIFTEQGKALNAAASQNVKCLLIETPCIDLFEKCSQHTRKELSCFNSTG